jgi:hypothetical protein
VFIYVSKELDKTKDWILASKRFTEANEPNLKKEIDESFGFVLWFIIYSIDMRGDSPRVSFEEACQSYAHEIEKARGSNR